jgi:hypothetical protein
MLKPGGLCRGPPKKTQNLSRGEGSSGAAGVGGFAPLLSVSGVRAEALSLLCCPLTQREQGQAYLACLLLLGSRLGTLGLNPSLLHCYSSSPGLLACLLSPCHLSEPPGCLSCCFQSLWLCFERGAGRAVSAPAQVAGPALFCRWPSGKKLGSQWEGPLGGR